MRRSGAVGGWMWSRWTDHDPADPRVLSDGHAVRQSATSTAWKAAAGLSLTDEAFHPTVLVLWRTGSLTWCGRSSRGPA